MMLNVKTQLQSASDVKISPGKAFTTQFFEMLKDVIHSGRHSQWALSQTLARHHCWQQSKESEPF